MPAQASVVGHGSAQGGPEADDQTPNRTSNSVRALNPRPTTLEGERKVIALISEATVAVDYHCTTLGELAQKMELSRESLRLRVDALREDGRLRREPCWCATYDVPHVRFHRPEPGVLEAATQAAATATATAAAKAPPAKPAKAAAAEPVAAVAKPAAPAAPVAAPPAVAVEVRPKAAVVAAAPAVVAAPSAAPAAARVAGVSQVFAALPDTWALYRVGNAVWRDPVVAWGVWDDGAGGAAQSICGPLVFGRTALEPASASPGFVGIRIGAFRCLDGERSFDSTAAALEPI